MSVLLLMAVVGTSAHARGTTLPRREIPAPVLAEVADLDARFEEALAIDCEPSRCFSTGCVYSDHAVADRPRASSLPGLGETAGPGSVPTQAWLTAATCGYVHEPAADPKDVQALTRRLVARVSSPWTDVSVSAKALDPLPAYFRDTPADETAEAPAEAPPPAPPTLSSTSALQDVWTALLPHFFWMVGIGLVTVAASVLVWAGRRLGQPTLDERLLLASLQQPPPPAEVEPEAPPEAPGPNVTQQRVTWLLRLQALDPDGIDPVVQALLRARLRAGDVPFLARAMLTFPDHLPRMMPSGGDVAETKLRVARFIEQADASQLPDEATFFAALDRHVAAAAISSQADAEVVRSLREDYGTAGVCALMEKLGPRMAGLVFALAPPLTRAESAQRLSPRQLSGMASALLESNRMTPDETDQLFAAVRGNPAPFRSIAHREDHGPEVDAAGALSVLLTYLSPDDRQGVLRHALAKVGGTAPAWMRRVLFADMVEVLDNEARADLLLGVPVEGLAAWLSVLPAEVRGRLQGSLPEALRTSLVAMSRFSSRSTQLARADEGRVAISEGLGEALARAGIPFEAALLGAGE